jgi:hypothetical protein
MGEYKGEGESTEVRSRTGKSRVSFDDALRIAVHQSDAEPGTRYAVTFEIVTEGDPKIGEYKATIIPL